MRKTKQEEKATAKNKTDRKTVVKTTTLKMETIEKPKGKSVAYVRVSTVLQNEGRQTEILNKYGIDKWFTEKISAKDTNRPELQKMLDYVREGDTVYVLEFSRLARSTKDLLNIVELLQEKGVELVSHKECFDTSTPTGKLMLTVVGAIAEFERENILERQREGIALAKKAGKYKGRKPVEIDEETFTREYSRYMNREITKGELAEALNVSRPTLDKIISLQNVLEKI